MGRQGWRFLKGARVGAAHPLRASRAWERRDTHAALRMRYEGGINQASVKIFTGGDQTHKFLEARPTPPVRCTSAWDVFAS